MNSMGHFHRLIKLNQIIMDGRTIQALTISMLPNPCTDATLMILWTHNMGLNYSMKWLHIAYLPKSLAFMSGRANRVVWNTAARFSLCNMVSASAHIATTVMAAQSTYFMIKSNLSTGNLSIGATWPHTCQSTDKLINLSNAHAGYRHCWLKYLRHYYAH